MSLNEEDRKALVDLYWSKSQQTLSEAKIAIENEAWNMAANRIYYACFHAVTALLVKYEHPVGSHIGAKINFGKYYVQTGLASAEQGRLFSQLASLREKADYNITFQASKEDIDRYFPDALDLLEHIHHLAFN